MNILSHSQTLAARLLTVALLLATAGSALAAVHYVDVNSTNPTPPFTNWSTAATIIQAAVDAAAAGDESWSPTGPTPPAGGPWLAP